MTKFFRSIIGNSHTTIALVGGLVLSPGLAGCDPGQGDARFEVWGEEYIEDEIPPEDFEDGWTVSYDKFLLVLGAVVVEDGGEVGGKLSDVRLYDLTKPGPHEVGELTGLDAGQWTNVGYRTPRANADTERHTSASKADLELMRAEGYSVYVEGSATKDDREVTFAWGFDVATRYEDCVDVRDGQQTHGLVVSDGATTTHQLTIHGDHLFYDDLASPDAARRFEALALADANGDGELTQQELADTSLSDLPSELGPYGVGSFDVDTLAEFVAAGTTSLGHYDGEGHCSATPQ